MRFFPHIRYGTESYPEKVARRLRTLNLAAWIVATIAIGFAVVQFLDPTPGMWKVAAVNAVAAPIFASVPLLHRFGPLSAALASIIVVYSYLFVVICLIGTGSGMQMYYLVAAGLVVLFFGIERILLSALLGILAVLLIVVLEIFVPHDTGLQPPATLFANFVATAIVTCALLMTIVSYALREAARAEENLVREHEVTQDKSRQLEIANKYKSHFLASASHDLRQPLHALNLFVAQLQAESSPEERRRLVSRIEAAVSSMNELFGALLDMTKLDAGILEPALTEFSIGQLLKRIEMTFADAAREKGLRLRVVSSGAWVCSDFILLERILLNLVSNAVRYTTRGGVVIGCRRRGNQLRIDICDSGPGIPEEQKRKIFGEFYQLATPNPDKRSSVGLGLGLAIVDRLGRLLGHKVELNSRLGRGSRFSISVPLVAERSGVAEAPISTAAITDPARGKLVVVIDDDALVLDGMGGILRSWGCNVVTADSEEAALSGIAGQERHPDLIISDYRLANGKTGIEAIERLRGTFGVAVPAFLISGDTAPERLRDASTSGYQLLHKPVPLMTLRAMLNRLLKGRDGSGESAQKTRP